MESEIMTCPYNPQHRLIRHRMPYHIVKCKKNYTGPPLDVCPYNAMHIVAHSAIVEHMQNCPDYHITMRETYEKQYPSNVKSLS